MSEDIKSSVQVWGGRPEGEDSPPEYSDTPQQPESSTTPSQAPVARRPTPRILYDPLRRLSNLATVPFHKYNITDATVSADNISIEVKQTDLYSHPQQLLPFILEQAHLPPKPTLRIVGSHSEYASGAAKTDFDITINLTHLLELRKHRWSLKSAQVSPLQGSSQVTYERDDPSVPRSITAGVKQFCKDSSENKSYILSRNVVGLPTEMLAGQVRNLAASVKYRGLIRIDFTCERSKVIVHKQPSGWFSNMLGLHPEKKYDMVQTVWSLSDGSDNPDSASSHDVGIRAGQEWWQSWSSTIRNAIIAKHRGNLGVDDWIETRVGRIEAEPRVDWGRDQS
ncbi:hypothetical protein H2198_001947 [Neophaeococcomyces mojaviensis]|uniref:Uncharacterized protein n=1 Tax=Neophaeococcomyces mojaviensis TaxID=3383035 RepID=A0ACC3AFT1_9EURO|nr:hypothetical protein H2198_001947 [Knufia sp. JES_112]